MDKKLHGKYRTLQCSQNAFINLLKKYGAIMIKKYTQLNNEKAYKVILLLFLILLIFQIPEINAFVNSPLHTLSDKEVALCANYTSCNSWGIYLRKSKKTKAVKVFRQDINISANDIGLAVMNISGRLFLGITTKSLLGHLWKKFDVVVDVGLLGRGAIKHEHNYFMLASKVNLIIKRKFFIFEPYFLKHISMQFRTEIGSFSMDMAQKIAIGTEIHFKPQWTGNINYSIADHGKIEISLAYIFTR